MPVKQNDKIKGAFICQIPLEWFKKLPGDASAITLRTVMLLWYFRGLKKTSKNLIVTAGDYNDMYSTDLPVRSFSRALTELVKVKMISAERHNGRDPKITLLCDECFETYPVINA